MMKNIKMIFGLLISAISLNTYAFMSDEYHEGASRPIDYDTYIGGSYKQNWVKTKGEWQKLFPSQQTAFDVYFGWRFVPLLGIELGYEWTTRKPKSIIVSKNGVFMGVPNNTGNDILMTGRLRFKTAHADLNAFIPLRFDEIVPEGIVSIGVAGMKPCVNVLTTSNAKVDTFSPKFTFIEGRSKTVLRVGLGVQAMVLENVGVRALWRFENTSVLRLRNSTLVYAPKTRDTFHNSQSLSLGLIIKF